MLALQGGQPPRFPGGNSYQDLDTIYSFEHFDFLHQDEDEEEQKERRCNTNIRFEAPDLKAEKSGS